MRSYNATGARGNIDTVAALETETRRLLREFLDSSNENELAMSPMDKHSRYIVWVFLLYLFSRALNCSYDIGMRLLMSLMAWYQHQSAMMSIGLYGLASISFSANYFF